MSTPTPRGLRVTVLRNAAHGDCSLNGISSTHTRLTVIGYTRPGQKAVLPLARGSRVFAPTEDAPAVAIATRRCSSFFGAVDASGLVDIVPILDDGSGTYTARPGMEGGNYADLSDSRLTDLVSDLVGWRFHGAVAIHDRFES